MPQRYNTPKRASDTYALPDIEVWEDRIYNVECPRCGVFSANESCATVEAETMCPSCERSEGVIREATDKTGWFYWFCFPGCLAVSEPMGPFDSEEEALADARGGMEDGEE